jgi:hypothetical protein
MSGLALRSEPSRRRIEGRGISMPLHADRFLTRFVFHPLGKALRRPGGVRIPILMYHGISDEPETGYPYFRLNTSRRRFSNNCDSRRRTVQGHPVSGFRAVAKPRNRRRWTRPGMRC